ncbi:Protein of unknown function [Thermobacillus xylanilyticus]|uniref:Uncharacterized protein n=1 Tax=Thermobacillus xylanilyticus TaxID=76633 RepID=A0ABN7SCL6_THEXY|nr:Protein of unknown function [Thermobacillus xylanilyticus]
MAGTINSSRAAVRR